MYFLFSDSERWHCEVRAKSWLAALRKAKAEFGIRGKTRVISYCGSHKEYKLDKTSYVFSLTQVE